MKTKLWVGTAKVDITPDTPMHLGTITTPRMYAGISHRLFARVIVLRQVDESGQYRFAIFVSADMIFFPNSCISSIRVKIMAEWGIEKEAIIFNATHTHSAPYPVYGYFASAYDSSLDEEFDRYIGLLEEAVIRGIRQSMDHLEPGIISRGTGKCTFSSHRRKRVGHTILMEPNENGLTDPEVIVVRFTDGNGEVKALMVTYACHPTTTYDDYISSEFPGVAMDSIEDQLGNGAVSMYLQGCCGDVKPRVIRDGKYYHGSDVEVCKFANELSVEAMSILARPMVPIEPAPFEFRSKTVELPFQAVPTIEELEATRNGADNWMAAWSLKLLAHPEYILTHEIFEATYIRLSEQLSFLAMNGEMVVEYGRFIKEKYAGVIPLGYSNGHTGYIPTSQQLAEGGYEGYSFYYNQGKPSPLDPCIEGMVKQGIVELMSTTVETHFVPKDGTQQTGSAMTLDALHSLVREAERHA